MELETAFSLASALATIGWIVLLASPFIPTWSDRIAGYAIPLLLCGGYAASLALSGGNEGGGFGSLAQVVTLFSHPEAVLAGWVHFLAFDLFVGGWQCRAARAAGMRFRLVVPCLVVTFFLGPLGLLIFFAVRAIGGKAGSEAPATRA